MQTVDGISSHRINCNEARDGTLLHHTFLSLIPMQNHKQNLLQLLIHSQVQIEMLLNKI